MPRRVNREKPQLEFMFVPHGFVCDVKSDPETARPLLADESLPWLERFEEDRSSALYELGFAPLHDWFTPSMRFLHRAADTFLRLMLQQPDIELLREKAVPQEDDAARAALLLAVPFAPGAEHVDASWLDAVFGQLAAVFAKEISGWDGSVEQYVAERAQQLRVPGRIFFHLVENKLDAENGYPFAFMATFAAEGEDGDVRHYPLRYALEQHEDDTRKLLELLGGLTAAAQTSDFLGRFMESGELFHPLRLTQEEAYEFLKDVPVFEEAGILCRVPNWWKRGAALVKVAVRVGENRPDGIGADALVGLVPSFVVDGVELTAREVEDLLLSTQGLSFIKGKWVEADAERLRRLLAAFEDAQGKSLSVFEAIREVAGDAAGDDLVEVTRGEWLDGLLARMRTPAKIDDYEESESLDARLRPYQQTGFAWLCYLHELGFGSCLADDMGLGKTVQLIAFVERLRAEGGNPRVLLVVPASLVGNWQRELEKFAPKLDFQILHGASAPKLDAQWDDVPDEGLREAFPTLSVTTYAMAQRVGVVARMQWDVLVLDEAQAIKNPNVKQTKALKALDSGTRIALTGTPVENDLANLWSVFDFLNPGMLGTLREFKRAVAQMEQGASGYAPLRRTVAPFLLRRLKTDKSIISDLPDKVEIDQFVELSRKQVILYRQVVSELERALERGEMSDVKRRGVVLGAITKLKQVCNHPDQFLGQTAFSPGESGKFQMLEELCRTIYEKRERVLVFTQFREMCDPLARMLEGVFERPGLVIHGQVPARKRTKIVEEFQGENYVPFMVLSLKAGGTGLNLTAANNVVHFDRWWNPAVENQATDRAFRIGQSRDVMVHKLICAHTLEERIADIIAGKSQLVAEVVGEGESWLGNLPDDQLVELLSFGAER